MKKFVLIFVLVFLCGISVFAQSDERLEKLTCPKIEVTEPSAAVNHGENIKFTVNFLKTSSEQYSKIIWSIDKGSIIAGQGTPAITVSTTGLYNEVVTATVEVEKDKNCKLSASAKAIVIGGGDAFPFTEFGKLKAKEIKVIFDVFLFELKDDSTCTGYIVNYGTAKQITEREVLIRSFVKNCGFDGCRIVFVNGGEEKTIRTRLWIIPQGADASTIN